MYARLFICMSLFLTTYVGIAQKTKGFTKEEIQLIETGSAAKPMRVLLTTSAIDEAILRKKSTPVDAKDKVLMKLKERLHITVNDVENQGVGKFIYLKIF